MFHLIEGLFFERLADGNVRILKTNGKLETDPVTFDMVIDSHQWDGVVAGLKIQPGLSLPVGVEVVGQKTDAPPIADKAENDPPTSKKTKH
jgi:hypothetical protein